MNKSRFLRLAGFALCIEFIVVIGLFVSKSNPITSSAGDVLPTQMVLPTLLPTAVPQEQAAAGSAAQTSDATTVMADPTASSVVASNVVYPDPTIVSPKQPVVDYPAVVPTETKPISLPPQVPVPNQVVLQFQPDAKAEEIESYVASVGGTVSQKIDALNTVVVNLPVEQTGQALPSLPAIVNSEPDYFVSAQVDAPPSDSFYSQQWSLPVIGAPDAWEALPSNAPRVTIAVIDSGICADHPDLQGRILPGWDFVQNDDVPQDEYGHGCQVAGIIAANVDDGTGIAGVATNAMILPLRVLDDQGIGTYSNVAAAIVRAADEGAQVINLSLGGNNRSSVLETAIDYAVAKHVTVVAAAGNTGGNVLYPAAYEPVVSVGSVDADLQRSSFSSYLPGVDTLAPGSGILTTTLGQSYSSVSGTSFAASTVSGIVALDLGAGYTPTFDGSVLAFGEHEAGAVKPTPESTLPPINSDDSDVQPLAVIGADGRSLVTNTTQAPNSAIVLILFDVGLSPYICSGAIIAPEYVLTAGHCVYDEGTYSTNFAVYPGNNGVSEPYGGFGATLAYVPPAWVSSAGGSFGDANVDYDWALLKLGAPVPASIQPFAISSYSDAFFNGKIFTDAGYPADKCRYVNGTTNYCPPYLGNVWSDVVGQGDTQWTASNAAHVFSETPYLLESKIDTYGGQSGSPLYYVDNVQPAARRNIITGVLSHSRTPWGNSCYGTPGAQCPQDDSNNYFRRVTVDMLEALVTTNNVPFVNPSCYPVSLTISGSGTATRSLPRSMGCATGTYAVGTTFALTAVASPGWVLSGWTGATGDVNTTYTVTGAATITAVFVPQPTPNPDKVLSLGFYDDRDPNITYSSGWLKYDGAGVSANTLSFTNMKNAILSFAYSGTHLTLYRTMKPDRGPMEVCIDTGCITVDNYSPTNQPTVPFTVVNNTMGTHVVRIRNLSTSYIDLDAVEVPGQPAPLDVGRYQENNGNLIYSGNWAFNNTPSALAGGRKYTNDPNAKVRFDIASGVGRIVIYRSTYLTGVYGSMQVYVDGGLVATINNTSSAFQFGMPFALSVTPVGHTIELRNVGTTYSDLDQIVLMAAGAPLSVGDYQETEARLVYGGVWTQNANPAALGGARKFTSDANGTVLFEVDSSVSRITIYRTTYKAGSYGSMQVFVDGVAAPLTTIINTNTSNAFMYQQPFTFEVTPVGHTIVLKNVGTTFSDIDQISLKGVASALGIGDYQETEANLTYAGYWTPNTTAAALGGSRIYTNSPNGSVRFSVSAGVGRVTIYRSTYVAGAYGSMQVFVDGALRATINNISSTFLYQQPFTFEVSPVGHIIMLRNVGTTYSDIDQISLRGPAAALGIGDYQETDTNLVYNGIWTDQTTASALGNARKYTNDPNATVSFKVDAAVERVTIYRSTYVASAYGSLQVYVDGTLQTTINNTSSVFMYRQPFTFTVSPGGHTIMLKNVGTTFSDLDQITLQGAPSALGIGDYQETDANLTYTGNWTPNGAPSAFESARIYTNDPNGSVKFSITSAVGRVTIYRTTHMAGSYGSLQVFLDGAAMPFMTINNTSSTMLFKQPFTFNVVPGNHTIILKNVGTTYSDLDQITLEGPAAPLSVGSYQENDSNLVYNGVWAVNNTMMAFGSARKYTNDPNANVSFTIDNTVGRVTIYHTTYKAGSYGPIQVFLDNSPTALATINTNSTDMMFKQPFTFNVVAGNHVITLKNVGSTYSDIDQITLQPPGSQSQMLMPTATATTVTVTPTLTPTDATLTATVTPSVSPTSVETVIPTLTAAVEATQTDVPTETVEPSATPTDMPAPTETVVPTIAPTNTPEPSPTAVPTNTLVPTETVVPTIAPTDTPVPTDVPADTTIPSTAPSGN